MALLFWAIPARTEGLEISPVISFPEKTGVTKTDKIVVRLPHDGIPDLESFLVDSNAYMIVAHAGPLARHSENLGLPEFSFFKGLTLLEKGCANYPLFPEGFLTKYAGYFFLFKVQAETFSGQWKVTCPYAKKSRFFSIVGNREERKISLKYEIPTI